jgi:hypothetical protein
MSSRFQSERFNQPDLRSKLRREYLVGRFHLPVGDARELPGRRDISLVSLYWKRHRRSGSDWRYRRSLLEQDWHQHVVFESESRVGTRVRTLRSSASGR